jgi:hypothetical protein
MSAELPIHVKLEKGDAKSEAEKMAADLAAVNAKMAADAKASAKAEADAYTEATNRKRDTHGRFVGESKAGSKEIGVASTTASKESVAGMDLLGGAASGAANKFSSLAATALSIGAVVGVARSIMGAMQGANDATQKQLDKLTSTKNLIREITAMTGSKEGPSDAEVQKFIAIRKASGLTDEAASKFALEWHGAGEVTKGVTISETEFGKAEKGLARFAATQGGGADAAGTYGKLGGLLASTRKFEKGEDLTASTSQVVKILGLGVGDNPELVKQSAKQMGSMLAEGGLGHMKDERELAAVIATASRIDPATASETVSSTARVLYGFSEKWSGLLKDAKVDEHDSYVDASNKVFAKMAEAEKSGRNVGAWLSDQGVDDRGKERMEAMYRNRGMLNKVLDDNKVAMTGAEATKAIDVKYTTDRTLREGIAQAKLDEAKLHTAMPLQYEKGIRLEAQTRLEKQGEGESSGLAKTEDMARGTRTVSQGFVLPSGMTPEQLGRSLREEEMMSKVVADKGLEVPGRPTGLQRGRSDADVANWLLSGSGTAAYSAVGSTEELTRRVTPPAAMPFAGRTPGGMDTTPHAPPAMPRAPGGVPMASTEMMEALLERIARASEAAARPEPIYAPPVMIPAPRVITR